MIALGQITIDGKVAESSQKLRTGQVIELLPNLDAATGGQGSHAKGRARSTSSVDVKFVGKVPTLVYEDEDMFVVNKPCGLGVHPGSGMPLEQTLVGWALAEKKMDDELSEGLLKFGDLALEQQRPGIVHRLDKGTSGAIVLAKNKRAHELLSAQFARREAGRCYFAVVKSGVNRLIEARPRALDNLLVKNPCPIAFRADAQQVYSLATYIYRDPVTRVKFKVATQPEGKRAITHFCEVSSTPAWSLVECKLETGRTHQIRVHLNFLEFPILGDDLYAGATHSRMMLHAHRLELTHPRSGKVMRFDVAWPADDLEWLSAQGLKVESCIEARLKGIEPAV